jgi:AraC-like DNA-binding protein
MKKSGIYYFHSNKRDVEVVCCKNSFRSYSEHNHVSVFTIGLVLEGCIELNRKNQQIICNAGDFFIIPPYERHAICVKDKGYTLLTVCINKEFINEYDSITMLATLLKLLDDPVRKKLISTDQITSLSDVIDLLFASITGFSFSIEKTIDTAKNILEKEPEHNLNIEQLSKQVFVSKYHLIREFKEQIGLTPHQFQMQNRIRKAQHLLKEGKAITEVALATGFYDQSHFNKWFKRVVALTPSEYMLACDKLPDHIND